MIYLIGPVKSGRTPFEFEALLLLQLPLLFTFAKFVELTTLRSHQLEYSRRPKNFIVTSGF